MSENSVKIAPLISQKNVKKIRQNNNIKFTNNCRKNHKNSWNSKPIKIRKKYRNFAFIKNGQQNNF